MTCNNIILKMIFKKKTFIDNLNVYSPLSIKNIIKEKKIN
jgi:hypothetical protein